ncbi:MAG: Tad domain-containing protein [Chloroflexi bacterium]|nr:Tad domain-containing protein [Chloroflexota bacterium]
MRRQEKGVTLIYLALVLMVLIGFAGIAIDGSNVYMQRRRMQTAADAAALTGIRSLAVARDNDQVIADLTSIAQANGAGSEPENIQTTRLNDNTMISVQTSATFPTYFAKLFYFDDFTVGATAKAEFTPVKKMKDLFPLALPCDCVALGQDVTFENQYNDTALASCLQTPYLYVKPGESFNIRDYVHYADSPEAVDWTKVTFTYAIQPQPANWHLSDFNSGTSVTVAASDAAAGTGNAGAGRYRIIVRRTSQTITDDTIIIRVQNTTSVTSNHKCPAPVPSTNPCKFTWLDWDGPSTTSDELFENIADFTRSGPWEIGDWVNAGPPWVTNLQCKDQLDQLLEQPVHIPLYNETVTDGSHNSTTTYPSYQICGFAEFVLKDYNFNTNPKTLTGEFVPAVVKSVESDAAAPDYGMRSIHLLNADAATSTQ